MRVLLFSLLACSLCLWAQDPGSAASSEPSASSPASAQTPDSQAAPQPADVQTSGAPVTAPPADRDVSWLALPGNIAQDQRAIWLAPLKLKERKYWIPTAAIVATTVGLMAIDAKEGHYFRNSSTYNGFNNIFSSNNTQYSLIIAPFALYGAGLLVKDSKMKSTALLAGEAVIDSEILTTVLKDIDRRKRPMDFPANGNFYDSWFDGKAGGLQGNGSFPSGHTIAAFSIATVIARRYGNHKWVPYVAYGTAAMIGFSRLTLSSHFSSDVFVGGVLGYAIARFDVLRQ
jgi:membrane-associated phospholipid phosphatase